MPRVAAVIFDAYGTLLDVHAAMARHAARLGPDWQAVSADWRAKQIEYTWVRSLAGPAHHRDFWRLTEEALAWTAARHHIADTALLADILLAYRRLDAYPEVPAVLPRLGAHGHPARHPVQRRARHAGRRGARRRHRHRAGRGAQRRDGRRVQAGSARLSPRRGLLRRRAAARWRSSRPTHGTRSAPRSFGFQVFWLNRSDAPAEYDLRTVATELTDLAALPDLLA